MRLNYFIRSSWIPRDESILGLFTSRDQSFLGVYGWTHSDFTWDYYDGARRLLYATSRELKTFEL